MMKNQDYVYERVSIEEMLEAVLEAGHAAEIVTHDNGRRTLKCSYNETSYTVQFYPNEGHENNEFGAIRFVAWFSDDNPDPAYANDFNSKFRFANLVAEEDCYVLQHDIVAIGASKQNLVICTQQWSTSVDDFLEF